MQISVRTLQQTDTNGVHTHSNACILYINQIFRSLTKGVLKVVQMKPELMWLNNM